MSDNIREEPFIMSEQLEKLEKEFKIWVKEFGVGIQQIVSIEIKALSTIIENHMKSNETEHTNLRNEISHHRKIYDELFSKIDVLKESNENKITAVRLALEDKINSNNKEIAVIRAEPALKAQKLMSTLLKTIIVLLVGASFTALLFWIQNGAPK